MTADVPGSRDHLAGETVGSFSLIECLDDGGASVVYLGEHPTIHSRVVIKVLLPHLISDAQVVQRFLNEARTQNRIGHPGIIPITDCINQPGVGLCLIMDFVQGATLAEVMAEQGRFTADRAGRVVCQIASAMGAAHHAGVIHRKLKPSNVILSPDPEVPGGERVRIFGFGVAKLMAEVELDMSTRTGIVLGVPRYASPEQSLDAKSVDLRTDIYSLGAMAYELLSGRPPYEADSFAALVIQQAASAPRPLRELDDTLPEALGEVVHRALRRDREQRYDSMEQLREAISRALPGAAPMVSTRPGRPDLPGEDAAAASGVWEDRQALRRAGQPPAVEHPDPDEVLTELERPPRDAEHEVETVLQTPHVRVRGGRVSTVPGVLSASGQRKPGEPAAEAETLRLRRRRPSTPGDPLAGGTRSLRPGKAMGDHGEDPPGDSDMASTTPLDREHRLTASEQLVLAPGRRRLMLVAAALIVLAVIAGLALTRSSLERREAIHTSTSRPPSLTPPAPAPVHPAAVPPPGPARADARDSGAAAPRLSGPPVEQPGTWGARSRNPDRPAGSRPGARSKAGKRRRPAKKRPAAGGRPLIHEL